MNEDLSNMNTDIPSNAVSLYGQDDAMDDFPVLKAFQQYIDSEQAKARKRMLMLSVFFGFLMMVVVVVFVVLLFNVSARNQSLNDRMLEYVMKERERPNGSAVVVQPPQDNSAILALTTKLDEMQKKLTESQAATIKAEQAAAEAAEAAKPKVPTAEENEILRLKALLKAEKDKANVEKERQHQAEIEAYRRKHYPELYQQADDLDDLDIDEEVEIVRPRRKKGALKKKVVAKRRRPLLDDEPEEDDVDALLKDVSAISYFYEDAKDDVKAKAVSKDKPKSKEDAKPEEKSNSIPVEIKGSSASWSIPLE